MSFTDCQLENFDILPSGANSVTFRQDSNILSGSLKGISKSLKKCNRLEINRTVKKGLLEVFSIDGMKEVIFNGNKNGSAKCHIELAIDIINKHLKEGGDVFDCQEALIEAGLKEYC